MSSVKINEQNPMILKFDGEVLEVFGLVGHRFHISLIKSITLTSHRGNHHTLELKTVYGNFNPSVDEIHVPATNQLINEIQHAMNTFKFDDNAAK